MSYNINIILNKPKRVWKLLFPDPLFLDYGVKNMTSDNLRISSALEDYLEAIYVLSRAGKNVRITDIAMYLGISKPSVNRAVNSLKMRGLVSHEPYGDITLTQSGREIGAEVTRRHDMVKKFLMNVLHLNETEAETEACGIEHAIGANTLKKMETLMEG